MLITRLTLWTYKIRHIRPQRQFSPAAAWYFPTCEGMTFDPTLADGRRMLIIMTEFAIAAESQVLTVITYGIEWLDSGSDSRLDHPKLSSA